MFHLLLVLAVMLVVASGTATFAHADDEKTDIGAGGDIKYLTSYVYPDGSSLKGEVRLVDTRDYHMLVDGTDVSFSAEDDGNGGYDLTVTALETSEKYTGSYTCKAEFIGIGKPVSRKISSAKGTWVYMHFEDPEGWDGYAVLSYTPGTNDTASIRDLPDSIEDELCYVLPGTFNGATGLKTAVLGDMIDYEPYLFINCPNLALVNLFTDEFTAKTKNKNDIKPLHLGPIEATNMVGGETVNRILLKVNRKAKWTYTDENDNDTEVLTMVQYCGKAMYGDYYIMETNTIEYQEPDSDWAFRVTLDEENDPVAFTVRKYNPPENDSAAWNVKELTLPTEVTYADGEVYTIDDMDFDLETNVFDGLPKLETIDTGSYRLTAPLANNCPKLTKIVSHFNPDTDTDIEYEDDDTEYEDDYVEEIWQDDCENCIIWNKQPLVNGNLDSLLSVVMEDDFAWTTEEPKTDEKGNYIDPEGNIVDDPDDADRMTYRMSQYCAYWGYDFAGAKMEDCRLRINAHDSLAAIAGMGPLKLSIWRSYDPADYDDEDAEWYPASRFFENYEVSDWAVTGNEDILQYVSLNAENGTITVDPELKSAGRVTLSCKVKPEGKLFSFSLSSELDILPLFSVAPGSRILYIQDEGDEAPLTNVTIPFVMNAYAFYGEESTGFDGDPDAEQCYAEGFSPYLNWPSYIDDGGTHYEQIPEWEPFHPDKGVTSSVSLQKVEGGREPDQIAEFARTGEGQPLYLVRAKEGAEEGDRFIVNGTFTYNGNSFELSSTMKVMKQRGLSEEDKKLLPDEGSIVVGTFFESQTSNLANKLSEMYPELQGRILVSEMDAEDWTDPAVAYADYMAGIEDYMFDESDPEWMPDVIIWPQYMLKGQQGGPAAAAFEDSGISFTGDAYHRYGGLGNIETSGGKTYAVATSVEPGGFVYNKAVARAVIGSDDPAKVQEAIGTWEGFVDTMGVMTSGEVKDGGSLRISSDKYYMLSSLARLDEAMVQGTGTVDGDSITLDGSVLDYMTIRKKLDENGLLGSASDLTSGKALGRFATELDTLTDDALREGISSGALGVVRGPSTFAGEGTEFATVTAKGAEENAGLIKLVLGLMLKDQSAMSMAYEADEAGQYLGSMFINNSEWQASLDSSYIEGAGIRSAWNAAAADAELPLEDPISSYVQTIIADNWDSGYSTSTNALASVLSNEFLPVIKAVDENDTGRWAKEKYNTRNWSESIDVENTKRLDLRLPYEDPETGLTDETEQARFDKYAAASYVDANGDEVYCYSLTRAAEGASADDAPDTAAIKLYNDMAYSQGSFTFDDAVIDLNGSSLSGPGSADQGALIKLSNGGSLRLTNTAEKLASIDGSSGMAVVDARSGRLDVKLGSADAVKGHVLLRDDASEMTFSTTACAYDETAATDLVSFAGRKSYIESFAAGDTSGTFAAIAGLITDESFTAEMVENAGRDRVANLYVLSDGYEYVPDGPAPEILANECFRIGKADAMTQAEAESVLTEAAMNEYVKAVKTDLGETADAGRALLEDANYKVSAAGDGSDVRPKYKWVTEAQRQTLEDAIEEAETAMAGDDLSAVFAAAAAVSNAMEVYENAAAGTKPLDRDDLLEDISDAVTEASGKKDGVLVSAAGDGSDIEPTQKWVTQEVMDALVNAIDAATAAATDDSLDEAALSSILSDLNDAMTAFTPAAGSKAAVQPSTGPSKQQQPAELVDLPSVKIKSAKAGKKKATVKWKKPSKKNLKKIAKIQIQYSTSKFFNTPDTKTKLVSKKKASATIKKLKSKKTYYFRVRAYKRSGGRDHVSHWSKTKKAKVK